MSQADQNSVLLVHFLWQKNILYQSEKKEEIIYFLAHILIWTLKKNQENKPVNLYIDN